MESTRLAPARETGERAAFEAWLKVRESGKGYPADLWEVWQARASLPTSSEALSATPDLKESEK